MGDTPQEAVRDLLIQLSSTSKGDVRREEIREQLVLLQMPLVHHLAGEGVDGRAVELQPADAGVDGGLNEGSLAHGFSVSCTVRFATDCSCGL